eukprot:798442_1
MSWQAYIQAVSGLGFTKATIVARSNYQTLACSANTDIATAWQDGDTQVNENQELLDDWTKKTKKTFCFYGKKFNIILRDPDDSENCAIVCAQGNEVCIARQFQSIWFIAFGCKKKMTMQREDKKKKKEKQKGFSGAQQAYSVIMKEVWDALDEASV